MWARHDLEQQHPTLLTDGQQRPLEQQAILCTPAIEEFGAAELHSERLAQPRPGQPETVAGEIGAFENERLWQDRGNPRRLDLEPAWRDALAAYLVPVGVEGLGGFLLHFGTRCGGGTDAEARSGRAGWPVAARRRPSLDRDQAWGMRWRRHANPSRNWRGAMGA